MWEQGLVEWRGVAWWVASAEVEPSMAQGQSDYRIAPSLRDPDRRRDSPSIADHNDAIPPPPVELRQR